jgi:hypothetical protein
MTKFSGIFTAKLFDGLQFRYSDGSAFDPSQQERTDPIQDILKKDEERREYKISSRKDSR